LFGVGSYPATVPDCVHLTGPLFQTKMKAMSAISSQDISFVVQGAIDRKDTPRCLRSVRQWFPKSEVVLSTWDSSDVSDLDYDVLVTSADPGAYDVILPPGKKAQANGNRQIVSTRSGLLKATRKYAVKLRNDIMLTGDSWLDMFDRFPERVPEWRMFEERLIIGSWYARNPRREVPKVFHPSDWFMFGLREDLLLLWDIDLEAEPESAWWFRSRPHPKRAWDLVDTRRYFAEQYLWKTLMSRFGKVDFNHFMDASAENIRLTELTFANNLIILEPHQFPFTMLKYPNPKRAWRYACYSHREWVRLYRHYCCGEKVGAAVSRILDWHHFYEACYVSVPKPVRVGVRSLSGFGRKLITPARG
jgi:hypothetical protein